MQRTILFLLLGSSLAGCTAAKSTYHLTQASQAVYMTRDSDAPEKAIYEWTKADEYMKKASEEWGYADYGPAEDFARKASEWSKQADQVARTAQRRDMTEQMPSLVPDEVDRTEKPDETDVFNREEKLDLDDLDEDLDEEE